MIQARQPCRHRQVALNLPVQRQALGRVAAAGRTQASRTHQCHLGPHRRPINRPPGQQRQGRPVATGLQRVADESPGQARLALGQQVHETESQVAQGVDVAQRVIELQRVKQHRRAVEPEHVAQVQITMHLAHMAGAAAQVHQAGQRGAALLGPALQRGHGLLIGLALHQAGQFFQVLARPVAGGLGAAVTGRRRHLLGMKSRHRLGQVVDHPARQLSPLGQPVKPLAVIKPAHVHRPVQHRRLACSAVTGQCDAGAAGGLAYRHHRQVPARRGAAVQTQLLLAGLAPRFERRKIDKTGDDRLLELVDLGPGQHQGREVGLDQARGAGRTRTGAGLAQCRHHQGMGSQCCRVGQRRGKRGTVRHGANTPLLLPSSLQSRFLFCAMSGLGPER